MLLFCVFAALGVIGAVSSSETVYWGTFTGQVCEPARFGCQNIGTWDSDDGTIHLEHVHLDGALQPVDMIRASYRPTGLLNDADTNIVHTEFFSTGGIWAPWIGAVAMALAVIPVVGRLRSESALRRRVESSAEGTGE